MILIPAQRPAARSLRRLGVVIGLSCCALAFAQQSPNWGAPGGPIGASSAAQKSAVRASTPARSSGIGTSQPGIGVSASPSQTGLGARGRASGPTGSFSPGTPGVYGGAVTTPRGGSVGQSSIVTTPSGGRLGTNQPSQGQLGSSQLNSATQGIGKGSSGGGGVTQHGGQGMHLNNGGRFGAADDPSTSTGSGTVTGATDSTSTGIGGTGGSPGTASGSDPNAQASAMKTALGKAWAATSSLLGSPTQGTESTDRAVAGVRGEASPVETYGPGSPNATGQKIRKGNSGNGDSGSGWGTTGNRSTGGRNAQGQVINAGNAGNNDAPLRKPGQVGVLNTNRLNNGVTDPAAAGIQH